MIQVLIIDDDPNICIILSELLKQMGHGFEIAKTAVDAQLLFNSHLFDLVLLDLTLPDGNGLDLLPQFTGTPQSPEVIIISGTGDVRGAALAFKYGAWDYVQKPFLLDEVSLPITRALQYRKEKLDTPQRIPLIRAGIIGESDAIQKCLMEVGKAAASDAGVLVTGETGTGKELFSRAIHANSRRASRPFIAVDCGALPKNLLESTLFGYEKGSFTGAVRRQDGLLVQANGGTLMLDEIGDLPLDAQKTFLRTLQERCVRPIGGTVEIPVDIRLVAATNLDLDQRVKQGLFRQDLLYRIRAMEIKLPPLRDRSHDIEEITLKKIHALSHRYNIENKAVSSELLAALKSHDWPGNVRELINVLDYVLASAGNDPTLFPKHLPPKYRLAKLEFEPVFQEKSTPGSAGWFTTETDFPTLDTYRKRLERDYLKELLNRAKADRKEACRISGISQSRLYGLLKKHGLPGFGSK
jgi:DNA-binding NtrC family response regulator